MTPDFFLPSFRKNLYDGYHGSSSTQTEPFMTHYLLFVSESDFVVFAAMMTVVVLTGTDEP